MEAGEEMKGLINLASICWNKRIKGLPETQ